MSRFIVAAVAGLLVTSCQTDNKPTAETPVAQAPAATENTTLALPAPPADRTAEYLANPQVGDVLVVRFVPEGTATEQFYFYQVFRLRGDTVFTHPARQPAPKPDADASRPDVFATEATRAYTRRELIEYQQESPTDRQRSRLVRVRRGE